MFFKMKGEMMKEKMKFRCYNPTTKRMYDVNYINFFENSLSYVDENNEIIVELLENVELMKFTNLKDKNGIEICEGDILEFPDLDKQSNEILNKGIVVREDNINALSLGNLKYEDTDFTNNYINYINIIFEESKILGNIYQNPQLLEK